MYEKKEIDRLHIELMTDSESYTKPIRIYCDVDGVIRPYIHRDTPEEELPSLESAEIEIFNLRGFAEWDKKSTGMFSYSKTAADSLSVLSHRDDVDFVWLTSWKVNAPYALDELLDIKSVGFLDWQQQISAFEHAPRGWSIMDDQELSPSRFIWIDDVANKRAFHYDNEGNALPYFSDKKYVDSDEGPGYYLTHRIDPNKYLTITTDKYTGLTKEEYRQTLKWIEGAQ
jgi:hypothetical protein